METKEIHCMVACRNASGEPELVPVRCRCTPIQMEEGLHYDAVRDYMLEQDYEKPVLVFDEVDCKGTYPLSTMSYTDEMWNHTPIVDQFWFSKES